MCFKDMDIINQDNIAVTKLNQLLLQMQNDFLPAANTIPRSTTCHEIQRNVSKNSEKESRKISLPVLSSQMKEEVVGKLDGLLGHLETSLLARKGQTDEPPYAVIKERYDKCRHDSSVDKSFFNGTEEEPQYSTIDELQCLSLDDYSVSGSTGYSDAYENQDRYVLEDVTCYLNKSWFSRSLPRESKVSKFSCNSLGRLKKFQSSGGIDNIHNHFNEHSSLCRRLRGLEASVGITLRKQLHLFIKKKMKLMNVSGCIYCMYSFYEKHKKDAEEKARHIRRTIKEQEYIQQKLNEQKKQSDADSIWLENEERFSYLENGNSRYSWRNGLHKSGAKSDSEQLGYETIPLPKKKKLTPLRLRRKIPLWELLKREKDDVLNEDDTQSTEDPTESSSVENIISGSFSHTSEEISQLRFDSSESVFDEVVKREAKDRVPFNSSENEVEIDEDETSVASIHDDLSQRASQSSDLDSFDKIVYQHTANVVKSVMELSTGVQLAKPEEFVDLVNVVGLNLRDLLAEVEEKVSPVSCKEIEMAQKVLSSDMMDLVDKMKIAQKYAETMLDRQNRRNMLQAAHVVAIDAKNLYDTYSKLRFKQENSNPS